MTGSHEVRGSIPLGSTNNTITTLLCAYKVPVSFDVALSIGRVGFIAKTLQIDKTK